MEFIQDHKHAPLGDDVNTAVTGCILSWRSRVVGVSGDTGIVRSVTQHSRHQFCRLPVSDQSAVGRLRAAQMFWTGVQMAESSITAPDNLFTDALCQALRRLLLPRLARISSDGF